VDIYDFMERNANLTDEELAIHYRVQPGGSWLPTHCSPTFKGGGRANAGFKTGGLCYNF
jgi:hypothetical protein